MRPFLVLLAFSLWLTGCHSKPNISSKESGYSIGLDPTWYPLQVPGKENNILAFSIELLTEIAKIENLEMVVERMNWDNLMWGLREHKYHAILSTMRPYTFYLKEYSFSYPYLLTGPVIVLPKATKSNNIEGKEIGVVRGSSASLILQTTPNIILEGYDSIPDMFEALMAQQIDGAAVEILTAESYLQNLYPDKFRIASKPINDMGLRLISIQNEQSHLINHFDRGLKKLKENGAYDQLLKKWGLSPDAVADQKLDKKASAFIESYF